MEIWKKCKCVESDSKYEISNFGNCRRKLLNGNYKVVKGSLLNRGPYRYFQVLRNKKKNKLFISSFGCEVFHRKTSGRFSHRSH